ncbi:MULTISPECIES: hypothetical protein [unclassified Sphingomonas]|uniref:hypothetical protein n=1 Tax=unclassified Sphingomonas TaxID=196159 RepID=UPI000700F21C|nr:MULTISPECIES: hypothetical protein [unclassified Sphingomonas]KQM27851.1 hypothetical protein ASE58_05775 [Sphingomonas sp. Leaf9]KQM44191.1 hypothetical protein ASE57_05770 [Sphingomonas sp. Leaf11]
MMSMVEDWGTARERQRKRRRWKWVAIAIVAVAVAPILATFIMGVIEGHTSVATPDRAIRTRAHASYIATAIAMLAAVTINYRIWRAADEVERRQMTDALALGGIVALVTLPILSLAAVPLGFDNPGMIGWGLAIAALVTLRIVQRLRG